MPKISVIVPVFFNESNLPLTIPVIQETVSKLEGMEAELIFVDDGSEDRSYEILLMEAAKDSRIKILRLAKNVGAHTALLAGLDHASGDCITFIMADMQDPPELIIEMVARWRTGSKIVLAERVHREDPWIDRIFAGLYWRYMHRFASKTIPKGGFDFVLFDRVVADILTSTREKNSHIMMQVLWTGFKPATIPYTRRERKHGKSKWSLSKKLKLFIDSSIAFSAVPIRTMSLLGISTALLGFLYACIVIVERLRSGVPVPGWASLTVIILILGGIQMMLLGVIGEYIWRTYDQTRNRREYIVAERINVSAPRM